MFPPEDENYRGVMISGERTPDMHATETPKPTPVVDDFVPGSYRVCYMCGIETARLQPTSVVSLCYTKEQSDKDFYSGKKAERYVLTYCLSCYSNLKK